MWGKVCAKTKSSRNGQLKHHRGAASALSTRLPATLETSTTTGHFLLLTFIRFMSRRAKISERGGGQKRGENAHQSGRQATPGDGETDGVCRRSSLGILLSP